MKKKLLSMICAICTVFMLLPMTISAETNTYDVWQVGDKIYYAGAGEHTNFDIAGGQELPGNLPDSGTYILRTNIDLTTANKVIDIKKEYTTLNLNGMTVNGLCDRNSFIIYAKNISIEDSSVGGRGTITTTGEDSTIYMYVTCSLTLRNGTIAGIVNEGMFYADGGTVTKVLYNNGGTVTQHPGTEGTKIKCKASNDHTGTIDGGIFYGMVTNYENATIKGGVFYGEIENKGGTITDPYHTVSFDLNEASVAAPVTQYFVNTDTAKALEPDDPVKDGYEFAGWYNGDTKYNFTENVTGNITLKAKWESIEKPVITGLDDGKTYCDAVQFEVSDNVGVASVTANGVELTPDANNKYTLKKGTGEVTVVAKDKAGNETSVSVTVNNGHTGGTATCTQKANCAVCGEEYGELANHSLSKTDAKEATCTEEGNIEYWECSTCDKLFKDETGTTETTLADVTLKTIDHSLVKTDAKEATCTEDGNSEYWTCSKCHKLFSDNKGTNEISLADTVKEAGHKLTKVDAKDSTVASAGNIEYWQYDDCDETFSDAEGTHPIKLEDTVISKLVPEIIKGKGQSVIEGTKKALSFTSNAPFNQFKQVKLDGKTLDSKNYTTKEGSIVVTLNSDFVSTLKVGKHTISIVSESGEASTEFEVIKKEVVKDTSKKDNSNKTNTGIIGNAGLWISMMASSLDALLIGVVLKKKKS